MFSEEHTFQLLLGLRIIKFIPEFHNYTMTQMAHSITHNTSLPPSLTYDQTVDKVSLVVRDYLGESYGGRSNTTALVRELDAYLATQPHGQNDLVWHYPFGVVITVVTGLLTILRLYGRWVMGGRLKVEDWSITCAMAMSVGITALMENSTKYGGGWYVVDVPWYKVAMFMRCAFICPHFYAAGIFCVKLSLLLFYRRLSPRRYFQVGVWGMIIFICLLFISTFVAMFFQCLPLSDWENPFASNCFDVVAFWTAYGALNMFSDLMIWILPVSVVWRLKLPLREKVQVILLFGLGLLVCVAAAMRILTLRDFIYNPDKTSGEAPNGVWSLIELNIGIICACIPGCKAYLTSQYAPRIIRRTPSINSSHMPSESAKDPSATSTSKGSSKKAKKPSKWSVTDSWLSSTRGRDEDYTDEEIAKPPAVAAADSVELTDVKRGKKFIKLATVKESRRESRRKKEQAAEPNGDDGDDDIEEIGRQVSRESEITNASSPPLLPTMEFESGPKRDSRGWML